MSIKYLTPLFSCVLSLQAAAQPDLQNPGELVDKIIGVVGGEIVLYSDLETAALEISRGKGLSAEEKCGVLENLLFQKLLLNQAKIDSVTVPENQVDAELNDRLNRIIAMFPNTTEFEKYYGKSVVQWKADLRSDIRDQAIIREERSKIVGSKKITPADVQDFFNSLPADSLPLIGASIEYSQLLIKPQVTEAEKLRTQHFLDSLRTDIINGKTSMTIQAARWSEDPGSKYKGGCYPLQPRNTFVPEYEAAVFNTPEGGFSPVFKTDYGYHFVKVVEKRGEYYESCHILMAPKVQAQDMDRARDLIDSLSAQIKSGRITFDEAVLTYSTDDKTKNQHGRLINPQTGGKAFELTDLPAELFFALDNMKPGETSPPQAVTLDDGNQAFVIYRLDNRTEAHRANLKDDYAIFKNQAEQMMQARLVDEWVRKTLAKTYSRIEPEYQTCPMQYRWGQNNP